MLVWRRERDSNSRTGRPVAGFQDQCIQPLCHPSENFSTDHRRIPGKSGVGILPKQDVNIYSGGIDQFFSKIQLITIR